MQAKLFVQNLTSDCSEDELQKLFLAYGEVVSSNIPKERDTGLSRGFGFVEMMSSEEALKALKNLNNKLFNGKKLHVAFSQKKRARKRSIAYSYLL